jgi:hypothetical protein
MFTFPSGIGQMKGSATNALRTSLTCAHVKTGLATGQAAEVFARGRYSSRGTRENGDGPLKMPMDHWPCRKEAIPMEYYM